MGTVNHEDFCAKCGGQLNSEAGFSTCNHCSAKICNNCMKKMESENMGACPKCSKPMS